MRVIKQALPLSWMWFTIIWALKAIIYRILDLISPKYQTPWGMSLNFDDSWCDEVRNFFFQNAMMWFRDFHIDGLRLDAVHAIKDLSAKHFLKELAEETELLSR
jgi:1,4-alpha-glucan branching enzyme